MYHWVFIEPLPANAFTHHNSVTAAILYSAIYREDIHHTFLRGYCWHAVALLQRDKTLQAEWFVWVLLLCVDWCLRDHFLNASRRWNCNELHQGNKITINHDYNPFILFKGIRVSVICTAAECPYSFPSPFAWKIAAVSVLHISHYCFCMKHCQRSSSH
jgi:hypothetical protein